MLMVAMSRSSIIRVIIS